MSHVGILRFIFFKFCSLQWHAINNSGCGRKAKPHTKTHPRTFGQGLLLSDRFTFIHIHLCMYAYPVCIYIDMMKAISCHTLHLGEAPNVNWAHDQVDLEGNLPCRRCDAVGSARWEGRRELHKVRRCWSKQPSFSLTATAKSQCLFVVGRTATQSVEWSHGQPRLCRNWSVICRAGPRLKVLVDRSRLIALPAQSPIMNLTKVYSALIFKCFTIWTTYFLFRFSPSKIWRVQNKSTYCS